MLRLVTSHTAYLICLEKHSLHVDTTCFCTGGKQQQGCICPLTGLRSAAERGALELDQLRWRSEGNPPQVLLNLKYAMLVSCSAALVAQS